MILMLSLFMANRPKHVAGLEINNIRIFIRADSGGSAV